MKGARLLICAAAVLATAGCSSLARGVTEALLDRSTIEDRRACHIEGSAWSGIEAKLRSQEAARASGQKARGMKIVMVHGIGPHVPGYSGRLTEKLMRELGLDVRWETPKEIVLSDPDFGDGPPGTLLVWRYTNKARTRDLLFYELTWSQIADQEKKAIQFDSSVEQSFRRTTINNMLKEFFNARVPDALLYLGAPRRPIFAAVRQTTCWATAGDWDDLPASGRHACDILNPGRARHLYEGDYAFVTHSLGSRIAIDALQQQVDLGNVSPGPLAEELRGVLQNKEISIFMLANQLPLLQLGQPPAKVTGQIDAYCRPGAELYAQRHLQSLRIHAFSDPNDILSYSVPPKFADNFLDSRMCPRITNVMLNVANPISLFGVDFANPAEAHGGYDNDDRVIAMIAHGLGGDSQAQIIKDRCTWTETIAAN